MLSEMYSVDSIVAKKSLQKKKGDNFAKKNGLDKYMMVDSKKGFIIAKIRKETAVNTTTFKFSFSFMPLTDTLNEEHMLNDGYIMRYGKAA